VKALLLTAPSELAYVDVPDPEPQPDEVLIRVAACGICGSDIHGWDGSSGRRRPPLVMGHEASGVIAAVGGDVSGWQPGDRVTFDSMISCGRCPACESGQINLCTQRRVLGVAPATYRRDGAFAEYVTVPARIVYRLPDELSFEHGAMAEPVSVALHAVARARLTAGCSVVVVGSGMIGLLLIQAARVAGAAHVVAVDLDSSRLALAQQLGATAGVVGGRAETLAELRAAGGAEGFAASFEVVGIGPTVTLAIEAVRDGGTVVLVGNLAAKIDFPLQAVVTRELNLLGTCASAGEYAEAIELIASGRIQVAPLISSVEPLASGAEWFRRLSGPEGRGMMKVMLQP
jgi:L-iditol 2-dehydrogenase